MPSPAELALLEPYRDKLPPELFTQEYTQPLTVGNGDDRDNLLKARQLLKDAGWTFRDGTLANDQGAPFSFEITLVQDGLDKVLMPWVHNLRRLGINATIRLVDTSQYANRVNAYDFDAIYIGINNSLAPGNEQIDAWSSDAADHPGAANYAGVKDPVVDALVRRVIEGGTYDDVMTAAHALDRVLTWNHYTLLTYTSPVERYAYWHKLQMPKVMPALGLGRMGDGAIALWWMDPADDSADAIPGKAKVPHSRSKAGALVWVLALLAIGGGIWRLRRSTRE